MANSLNFPNTPANGDIFTAPSGQKWIWLTDGPYWKSYADNVTVGNSSMTSTLLTLGGGVNANGSVGVAGQVLTSNGSTVYWAAGGGGGGGGVSQVDTGNGLTGGPIVSTGTISVVANSGIVANATGVFVNTSYIQTLSANNTTYVNGKLEAALNVNSATSATTSSQLGGKVEAALNVNSATTATNSTQLNGKTEGNLNVNSATTATTATNSTQLNSKTEGNLNVNSATSATTSSQLGGKTEANLNVNSAVTATTATNSTQLNGKTEGNLNVNSAASATTTTQVNGKIESALNVNSAVTATSASQLGGKVEAALNVNSATSATTSSQLGGKTEGNLNVNSAVTAVNANNTTYVNGKAESALNVNSATTSTTATNSTQLNGKTEGNLNVNSATSATTSSQLGGKVEAALNVNSAVSATSASQLGGKTEGNLNVNSAVTAVNANNTTYVNGKTEAALNVNSATTSTTATNSTQLNSKTESNLNVNSAVSATSASQLGGKVEAALNVNSATSATTSSQLGGKTEGNLNVNSAVTATTATNSTQLNSKTESNLNVNSAVTAVNANNTTYVNGKAESALNVNSATSATTSSRLGGKVEAALNVNSAVSATSASQLGGKTEGNLNVNSATNALNANNADFLDGQHGAFYTNATNISTGVLNIAFGGTNATSKHGAMSNLDDWYMLAATNTSFVMSNSSPRNYYITGSGSQQPFLLPDSTTVNVGYAYTFVNASNWNNFYNTSANSGIVGAGAGAVVRMICVNNTVNGTNSWKPNFLGGTSTTGSGSLVFNASPALQSPSLSGTLTLGTTGVNANGSLGTAGQVLTSNGTTTSWQTPAAAVNTNAQYVWSNAHVFAANATFGNSTVFTKITNDPSFGPAIDAQETLTGNGWAVSSSEFNLHDMDGAIYLNRSGLTITDLIGGGTNSMSFTPDVLYFGNSTGFVNVNSTQVYLYDLASSSDVFVANSIGVFTNNVTLTGNATIKGIVANGSLGTDGQVLTSNGTSTHWTTPSAGGGGSVNSAAQYTWTNTHTFSNSVTFSGGQFTNSSGYFPFTNTAGEKVGSLGRRVNVIANNMQTTGNIALGSDPVNDTRLYITSTWTNSDQNLWGEYIYSDDSNSSMTASRSKYGFSTQIYNSNQNKNVDGVTIYQSNYRAIQAEAYNGKWAVGGEGYAYELTGGNFSAFQSSNGISSNAVTNAYGSKSAVFQYGTGIITNAYGSFNRIYVGDSTVIGNINFAVGVYSSITSNTGSTIAGGYLFYGDHSGTTTTTKYGIYLNNESNNYMSGSLYTGGNVFIGAQTVFASASHANSTGHYPNSNTVGQALGSTTRRWSIVANTGSFNGNVGIGTSFQTDTQLQSSITWTSDASLWNMYAGTTDSNSSTTSARTKYGFQSSFTNLNQNKSSDGLTTYSATYRGIYSTIYNGSATTGGDAYANEIQAGSFRAYNYANGATSNAVDNLRGSYNEAGVFSNGVIGFAYGSWNRVLIGNSSVTGNIGLAYGVASRITSNTGATIGTGYLYHGEHFGTTTTTKYGVHLTNEGMNYFSGNVGIGVTVPAYNLHVNGSFAATTKSFVIDHPTKNDMFLRHGSLEGPENGVYVRGKLNGDRNIYLPDYWRGLVDANTISVNITPFGYSQPEVFVRDVNIDFISLSESFTGFYTVYAERNDVPKLEVEFDK